MLYEVITPYSQIIVFVISLIVVLYLLRSLVDDLTPDMVRHIKMAIHADDAGLSCAQAPRRNNFV